MFGAALLPFKARRKRRLLYKLIVPNFFESYLKLLLPANVKNLNERYNHYSKREFIFRTYFVVEVSRTVLKR